MDIQTPKKQFSFYSTKEDTQNQQCFDNASLRSITNNSYTPTTKKLMVLSSSESDSDSSTEDVEQNCTKTEAKEVSQTRTTKYKQASKINNNRSSQPRRGKRSALTPRKLMKQIISISPPVQGYNCDHKVLSPHNKYLDARKALSYWDPDYLPGREQQLEELEKYISKRIIDQSSGSLYIAGPPGTGKTVSIKNIISKCKSDDVAKMVYINCTTMDSASAIYRNIIQELGHTTKKSIKISKAFLEEYFTNNSRMVILVLDEIDNLETTNRSVLYTLFELPSKPQSKLILIGIANALDLTQSMLPRLQMNCDLKPELIYFASYTKQQIEVIISERLERANVKDVFTPNAIKLLAGKVAAVSGDIRRALDISRRVIELTESRKILQSANDNEAKASGQPIDEAADMKDVLAVLNQVYGGTQTMSDEYSFPLQQKLALCSLILILTKSRNKDVTVAKLHQVYTKVCQKRGINAVDLSEFVGLCSLIETRGILKIITKRQIRSSKVALEWDQKDVEAELKDKALMAEIIYDVSCLCE